MKKIVLQTVDLESRAYSSIKQDKVYWDEMPNGEILLCASEMVWGFSSDNPNAFIRYSRSEGVELSH